MLRVCFRRPDSQHASFQTAHLGYSPFHGALEFEDLAFEEMPMGGRMPSEMMGVPVAAAGGTASVTRREDVEYDFGLDFLNLLLGSRLGIYSADKQEKQKQCKHEMRLWCGMLHSQERSKGLYDA